MGVEDTFGKGPVRLAFVDESHIARAVAEHVQSVPGISKVEGLKALQLTAEMNVGNKEEALQILGILSQYISGHTVIEIATGTGEKWLFVNEELVGPLDSWDVDQEGEVDSTDNEIEPDGDHEDPV